MKKSYEVWVLGYNDNEIMSVNDYEFFIAAFSDKSDAEWFMRHYDFNKRTHDTPHANAVLERVAIDDDSCSCEDILMEVQLF